MDDFVFYQPPSASRSQPLRFPGTVMALHLPLGPIASLPARQTATLVNSSSQKTHTSDRHCGNDKQEIFTASRNFQNRNDDDDGDFPTIEELSSRTWKKSMPASDDPNGFIHVNELMSDMQQKGLTSVDPVSGMAVDMVDNGTRGGSPTSSSRSTAGSSQDPIILSNSDDESAGGESETDYSNLKVDLTVKSDSSSPHIANSDMANGKDFGSGTTYISDCTIADNQDDDNDSGVVDGVTLQLAADLPISASPSHRSVTHQASPMRVNSEITRGSVSYGDLDVTKGAEDEGIDVFADDEYDADTSTTRRSGSSAISSDNSASDSNVSLSELRGGQHDSTQPPQPGPAVASLEQSDLANSPQPRHRRRRYDTKNARHKRLRMQAPTGPAHTTGPISAALESNDFEHTQSVARLVALPKEREIRNIDHEIADDGGSDDFNNEDYDDMNDAAASEMRHSPCSRKRVKRAKDNNVETPSTHSLNVSYQATAATSSVSTQESEEIPIHGYLTLKTTKSKVVYCLTFSQILPEPGETSHRQGILRRDSERLPMQELTMSGLVRTRFSSQEDKLLPQLKGEGLSWDEISDHFPERSKGTLQVRYSTKLKPRSEKPKNTRKRRRSG